MFFTTVLRLLPYRSTIMISMPRQLKSLQKVQFKITTLFSPTRPNSTTLVYLFFTYINLQYKSLDTSQNKLSIFVNQNILNIYNNIALFSSFHRHRHSYRAYFLNNYCVISNSDYSKIIQSPWTLQTSSKYIKTNHRPDYTNNVFTPANYDTNCPKIKLSGDTNDQLQINLL